jgi:hypothetical protein
MAAPVREDQELELKVESLANGRNRGARLNQSLLQQLRCRR